MGAELFNPWAVDPPDQEEPDQAKDQDADEQPAQWPGKIIGV